MYLYTINICDKNRHLFYTNRSQYLEPTYIRPQLI